MANDKNYISVSQLNGYIAAVFSADEVLNAVTVKGEISNFKLHSSGHLYFSLKDEGAKINCVMFRSFANSLSFQPADGDNVIVYGHVGVYEKTGSYQLYVSAIRKDGLGALYEEYNRLLSFLKENGYMDSEHKKSIPYLPKKIALITSPTGAAVHDMMSVIGRRCPITELTVCPVPVQGSGAGEKIAAMIDWVNVNNSDFNFDLIIVARGGGSIEELWAFNEMAVAESVYNSEIPIISGVGHETDFTICDFVADIRAVTPSGAAELAVPDLKDIFSTMGKFETALKNAFDFKLGNARRRIEEIKNRSVFAHLPDNIGKAYMRVDMLEEKLNSEITAKVKNCRMKIETFDKVMESLSCENVLRRGYYLVKKNGGYVGEDEITVGDNVAIISACKEISAGVNHIGERLK